MFVMINIVVNKVVTTPETCR